METISEIEKVYTPKEVADVLRIGVARVYQYISDGIIPAFKLGNGARGPWRILESDLLAMMRATGVAPFEKNNDKS